MPKDTNTRSQMDARTCPCSVCRHWTGTKTNQSGTAPAQMLPCPLTALPGGGRCPKLITVTTPRAPSHALPDLGRLRAPAAPEPGGIRVVTQRAQALSPPKISAQFIPLLRRAIQK